MYVESSATLHLMELLFKHLPGGTGRPPPILSSNAFSPPEAALLLIRTKNRHLWPGPTLEWAGQADGNDRLLILFITYRHHFLHSNWLRTCQLIPNQCKKSEIVQNGEWKWTRTKIKRRLKLFKSSLTWAILVSIGITRKQRLQTFAWTA